jgi:general secretion pathway protein D
MRIGDRVPTATGSFQPGIGTVGVSPLVNTQFQFVEVGVNVDLVPKVHGADEVSLHVELEISAVKDRIDIGGILQPIIGQRKVVHDLRIREGEISLLGGLLLEQDTKTVGGIPGLASIPVLGRLFSSESIDRSSGALLSALVPHVGLSPVNVRGISAGNDQTVKLSYAARAAEEPPPSKPIAPSVPSPTKPVSPPAVPGQPGASASALSLIAVPSDVRVGGTVTVSLQMDGAPDLFSAPGRVQFDPKLLRMISMKPGGLLSSDGQQVNFTEDTRNDVGEAAFTLNRLAGAGGVTGNGVLVTFVFQALAPGAAKVRLTEITPRTSKLDTLTLTPPELDITIR